MTIKMAKQGKTVNVKEISVVRKSKSTKKQKKTVWSEIPDTR